MFPSRNNDTLKKKKKNDYHTIVKRSHENKTLHFRF